LIITFFIFLPFINFYVCCFKSQGLPAILRARSQTVAMETLYLVDSRSGKDLPIPGVWPLAHAGVL
jgi:hypothetical protein